jgi:hypothetical protein
MRRSWPSTVAEKDLDGRAGELGGEGAADRTGTDDCSGHGERTPSNGKTRRLSSAGSSAYSRAAEWGFYSRFPVNFFLTQTR